MQSALVKLFSIDCWPAIHCFTIVFNISEYRDAMLWNRRDQPPGRKAGKFLYSFRDSPTVRIDHVS
jgi:hypothetical protein